MELDKIKVLNKEIDLIQACINRMAQNSFMVKGWVVSLVAVVLTLLPETFDSRPLGFVGVAVTLCFWYLNGFFLRAEKLYRAKYDWVIQNRLSSDEFMYDLNPNNMVTQIPPSGTKKWPLSIWDAMRAKTLCPLYLMMLLLSILYIIYSFARPF